MSLSKSRIEFTLAISNLVRWGAEHGYELAFDDVKARNGHSPHSYHYLGLAADLNLYKDGEYLEKTEDHLELGEQWEKMGGVWGGRFTKEDGNHYQWKYNG